MDALKNFTLICFSALAVLYLTLQKNAQMNQQQLTSNEIRASHQSIISQIQPSQIQPSQIKSSQIKSRLNMSQTESEILQSFFEKSFEAKDVLAYQHLRISSLPHLTFPQSSIQTHRPYSYHSTYNTLSDFDFISQETSISPFKVRFIVTTQEGRMHPMSHIMARTLQDITIDTEKEKWNFNPNVIQTIMMLDGSSPKAYESCRISRNTIRQFINTEFSNHQTPHHQTPDSADQTIKNKLVKMLSLAQFEVLLNSPFHQHSSTCSILAALFDSRHQKMHLTSIGGNSIFGIFEDPKKQLNIQHLLTPESQTPSFDRNAKIAVSNNSLTISPNIFDSITPLDTWEIKSVHDGVGAQLPFFDILYDGSPALHTIRGLSKFDTHLDVKKILAELTPESIHYKIISTDPTISQSTQTNTESNKRVGQLSGGIMMSNEVLRSLRLSVSISRHKHRVLICNARKRANCLPNLLTLFEATLKHPTLDALKTLLDGLTAHASEEMVEIENLLLSLINSTENKTPMQISQKIIEFCRRRDWSNSSIAVS